MHPLTKKTDVLAVIAAGGKIQPGQRPGLLRLLDSAGSEVPAWQTALQAAAKSKGGSKAAMCGGCGNDDPDKRCLGCLHDFGGMAGEDAQ